MRHEIPRTLLLFLFFLLFCWIKCGRSKSTIEGKSSSTVESVYYGGQAELKLRELFKATNEATMINNNEDAKKWWRRKTLLIVLNFWPGDTCMASPDGFIFIMVTTHGNLFIYIATGLRYEFCILRSISHMEKRWWRASLESHSLASISNLLNII